MIEEHLELWLGLLACFVLGIVYTVYMAVALPAGGHPFGQFLGIIGMSLMVITELVYSIRKRVSWLYWMGSLRTWLSFHIFTGIVGPFLVLLHSAFEFGGLAGVAIELSGIVVFSGFVGRYIYTAVPRTRAGIEASREELGQSATRLREEIDAWTASRPTTAGEIADLLTHRRLNFRWTGVFTRTVTDQAYNRRVHAALRRIEQTERARVRELRYMLQRQHRLERQIASLEWVQTLMGIWRLVHIPLGITLFTTAIIHMAAALYYKGLRF